MTTTPSPTRAVFFDRDNTLIVNDGYLGDPAGVKLMPGAADAVAKARALGYAVVVISNQSGVARGLFTEDDVKKVDRRMAELLLAANPGAVIDRHDYCPFHPAAVRAEYRQDSDLRKPKPGMYLRCLKDMDLRAQDSWAVGDAPRDITAGKAAGLRTVRFKPPAIAGSPAADDPETTPSDFTATSLEQAMSLIERETPAPATPATSAAASAARNAAASTNSSNAMSKAAAPVSASTLDNARPSDVARLERGLDAIVAELKKANAPDTDFSIAKLLAGVFQIVTVALLIVTYVRLQDPKATGVTYLLLFAVILQSLVTSLLLMGRQK